MPKKQWFNDVFLPSLFEYAQKTVGLCKNCKISDKQFDICCKNMEEIRCYDVNYRKDYTYYRCAWNDRDVIVTRYKNNYISFSLNSVELAQVKQQTRQEEAEREMKRLNHIKQAPERLEKLLAKKFVKLEKLEKELLEAFDDEEDEDIIDMIKNDISKLQKDIDFLTH